MIQVSLLFFFHGRSNAIGFFQVLTDIGSVYISLQGQFAVRICGGILDGIFDGGVHGVPAHQIRIAFFHFAVILGRDGVGLVAGGGIHGFIHFHPVSSLHLYGILGQVLDHGLSCLRDVLQIFQVFDISGIGSYLSVQGSQVLARGLRSLYIFPIGSGTDLAVHCFPRHQLAGIGSDAAGADGFAPLIQVSLLFFFRGRSNAIGSFQVLPDVICIHISLHAVQFLQLCDVDGIGFLFTSSHASNLTSFICYTNGYSRLLGRPCSCSICCCTSGIIPGNTGCCRCFRTAANSHATFFGHFCVVADGYDVGGCRFIVGSIGRTDNDVVLLIRQFMVVAEDDIGLILVYAFSADLVVRTDNIVMFAVSQFVLEAIDEVVLRRRAFCIGAVCARDGVTYASDLSHIGFVNRVAAAHDHDLSAAILDSSLHSLTEFFRIGYTA